MPDRVVESVLVAGRGPAACAVMAGCARLGVKTVAVHSEADPHARHVRLADDSVLLGPPPAAESYLAVARLVEAARRSGVDAVFPVPPALAGHVLLAAAVRGAGLIWVGPDAEVLERLGGDGVEPASEQGLLAWVTGGGLRYATLVRRDRAAGIARVTWTSGHWTPPRWGPVPPTAQRLVEVGWRGLVTVGIDPDGELAEVAAGFSLDMAVLECSHGVDAVELALLSAVAPPTRDPLPTTDTTTETAAGPAVDRMARPAVAAQLRSTLPPGREGTVSGRLPDHPVAAPPAGAAVAARTTDGATADGGTAVGGTAVGGTAIDVEVAATTGYDPGDRVDGWYDALLATVSAAGSDTAAAARAVLDVLSDLPEIGVPHDGPEVCAVLRQLAAGDDDPAA